MSSESQDPIDSSESLQSEAMSLTLVRRERLQEWMRRHTLSASDVAVAYGSRLPYIRSILHMGDTHRNIGEKAARKLEEALGMPERHLDGDSNFSSARAASATRPIGATVPVPMLARTKQTTKLDSSAALSLPISMLEAAETRPEHAAWLRIESAEMGAALPSGSIALVNLEETAPVDSKIYVVSWRDQLIVRRLHLTPAGIRLSTDANESAAWNMSERDFSSQVAVVGRIRAAINVLI